MSFPLEIQNLCKSYGAFAAVKDVSLVLNKGEIFGLLGPNGAGKTSILSCIVNLNRPTSGSIRVFGKDVVQSPRERATRTGVVPQEIIHHGFFTVREVLGFQAGYYGVRNGEDWLNYLLKKLQLWEHRDKLVKQLSGGMKRRLMIAKALVHQPSLLLLDEPTAGVDIALRTSLWEFVRELRDQGLTILLTTHYLEEAESLCDRVGILQNGILQRVGVTAELICEYTQRIATISLSGDLPVIQHPCLFMQKPGEVRVRLPRDRQLGQVLSEMGITLPNVVDIRIQEGSLEEAFLRVLGGRHDS